MNTVRPDHRSKSVLFYSVIVAASAAHSVTSYSLTHISVQRTLKGSSQSQGQLSVVVTNHLPITIKTSYLESMPWLLQFYLHSLNIYCDGSPRGTCHSPSHATFPMNQNPHFVQMNRRSHIYHLLHPSCTTFTPGTSSSPPDPPSEKHAPSHDGCD